MDNKNVDSITQEDLATKKSKSNISVQADEVVKILNRKDEGDYTTLVHGGYRLHKVSGDEGGYFNANTARLVKIEYLFNRMTAHTKVERPSVTKSSLQTAKSGGDWYDVKNIQTGFCRKTYKNALYSDGKQIYYKLFKIRPIPSLVGGTDGDSVPRKSYNIPRKAYWKEVFVEKDYRKYLEYSANQEMFPAKDSYDFSNPKNLSKIYKYPECDLSTASWITAVLKRDKETPINKVMVETKLRNWQRQYDDKKNKLRYSVNHELGMKMPILAVVLILVCFTVLSLISPTKFFWSTIFCYLLPVAIGVVFIFWFVKKLSDIAPDSIYKMRDNNLRAEILKGVMLKNHEDDRIKLVDGYLELDPSEHSRELAKKIVDSNLLIFDYNRKEWICSSNWQDYDVLG